MLLITSFSNAQSLQNAIKLTDSEQYTLAEKELKDLIKSDNSKPEYYYYLAENFADRKEIDSAIIYWKIASLKNTEFPYTSIASARLRLNEKDFNGAKAIFDQVLAANKKNADLYRAATKALLVSESKLFDDALAYINKAIDLDPKNEDGYLLKGDALILQTTSNVSLAVAEYNNAINKNLLSPKGLVRKAKIYVRLKNPSSDSSANVLFLEAEKLDSNFAPSFREHAELYQRSGKFKKAITMWEKYLSINNSLESRYRYANALYSSKQYCEAINESNYLIQKGMNNFQLNRILMSSYVECTNDKENISKGLIAADKFFSIAPKDKISATDYKTKAQLLTLNGKDSLAIIELNKGLEIESKNKSEYLILLAKSYSKMKKYDKVAECYVSKQKLLPLTGDELLDLGRMYYNVKKYILADSTFAKLNDIAPTYARGFFLRGNTAEQLDLKKDKWLAKPYYEKVLTLVKPEERNQPHVKKMMLECAKYLVEYYNKQKDTTKANEILTILKEIEATDAQPKK